MSITGKASGFKHRDIAPLLLHSKKHPQFRALSSQFADMIDDYAQYLLGNTSGTACGPTGPVYEFYKQS